MSILLADDDVQLATFLSKSLESEGYSVRTAINETVVLDELKRQSYKLIILDLNFGRSDGLKLLQRIRSEGLETPVIVLSARNHVTDRIRSLNLGADDYVTKPFSFQELAARTSAVLRRKTDPGLSILRAEDLDLDPVLRKVHRGQREIKLSPREFDLLHLLIRRAGETISRNELLHECWGHEADTDSNLVDVYINYLRRKLEPSEESKIIFTIRGEGYRLGKPAPLVPHEKSLAARMEGAAGPLGQSYGDHLPPSEPDGPQEKTSRALVHAMSHDLAQPLTSIRCFLELLSLRKQGTSITAADLMSAEHQADRAIALAKGISAIARDPTPSEGAWIPIDRLFNDVANDFSILVHTGFLALERDWQEQIQVSSSQALRQLLTVIVAKLAGCNTRRLKLKVSARADEARCRINIRWEVNDGSQEQPQSASSVLARDIDNMQALLEYMRGELWLHDDQAEITLTLPTAPESPSAEKSTQQQRG